MYYKVIFNDKIIDVLDRLVYLKYQEKHNRMVLCDESKAQAIFSSDGSEIWHVDGMYDVPVSGYDTVRIEQIDKYEYKRLRALNCGTMEDVIDEFVKLLIDNDNSLLSDSLKRLYSRKEIDEITVVKLCEAHKMTDILK